MSGLGKRQRAQNRAQIAYGLDKIGNRQRSTGFQAVSSYTTNALNQYTAIDSATPTHDLDGKLTVADRVEADEWKEGVKHRK